MYSLPFPPAKNKLPHEFFLQKITSPQHDESSGATRRGGGVILNLDESLEVPSRCSKRLEDFPS